MTEVTASTLPLDPAFPAVPPVPEPVPPAISPTPPPWPEPPPEPVPLALHADPEFPAIPPAPEPAFVTRSEFYAVDRYHAATHVSTLDLPAELKADLDAVLGKLTHTGPVHVLIASGSSGTHDAEAADEAEFHATDEFLVRPFDFVQV